MLGGSCHIKVLRVLRTIPNRLGNISVGGIKEASERFAGVCCRGIIYIIVVYSRGSIRLTIILRLLRLSRTVLRLY